MLPFNSEQFFLLFATYNAAIWPAPIVAYGLGLLVLACLMRPGAAAGATITATLGLMWLWTGAVYHWLYFTSINQAALLFGAAFVAQGLLLLYAASTRRLAFGIAGGLRGAAGLGFIVYAALVYPLIGLTLGHAYRTLPMFGVSPCPVAIFTFGCVLLSSKPVPWWVLVVPVLWSLVGGSAAFLIGVPQDWLLLASGPATLALLKSTGRVSGFARS